MTSTATDSRALRIDIDGVLRERLPRHYRWLPRPLVSWIKRVVCQDELNDMLERNEGLRGAAFAEGVLRHLGVTYSMATGGLPTDPSHSRVIYVSNHPLGGLDGLVLIDLVKKHHGVEPCFLVNDLLMAVSPLGDVFVPVNKHGRQSRDGASALEKALEGDRPMIIFPAGLVSRRGKGGVIADLQWRPSFVNYAVRYGRDIIPLHFNGRNSGFFYKFAQWRKRLGLKFNIEMVRLPREVFLSAGSCYTISASGVIPHTSLLGGAHGREETARIRAIVDSLATS